MRLRRWSAAAYRDQVTPTPGRDLSFYADVGACAANNDGSALQLSSYDGGISCRGGQLAFVS